ncbi:hypothetical protein ACGGZK_07340 [Agromyces sp. MMS24-K17]|uniref:hypothetical protein n=1 Tax=Agromyces sp. MMS24-K17 TaxID=3372850 RepID=UPI003754E69D
MTSRLAALAAVPLLALALAGCAGTADDQSGTDASASASATEAPAVEAGSDSCEGVRVIVDAGDLEPATDPSTDACVGADAPIAALDALAEAGVETEGTEEYGDQIVCRVNGEPAEDLTITAADGTEYHETCASMPAAFAYWALWVKTAGGEWGYAQEGLSTLELAPGESVQLLFTLNDQPASPAA